MNNKGCQNCRYATRAANDDPCSHCMDFGDPVDWMPKEPADWPASPEERQQFHHALSLVKEQAGAVVEVTKEAFESDPFGKKSSDPGAKNDAGKTRWSILPWEIIEGVAKVMTFGAAKYSDNGWKAVPQAEERYFSAMMRHWRKIQAGEIMDDGKGGTGEPHWSCFVTNAVFLGYFYSQKDNK